MLTNPEMLREHMSDIVFTEHQRDDALIVLAGVQAELEKYLNRPLEPVLVRETVQTEWDGTARYRYSPIISIVDVTGISGQSVYMQPLVPVVQPIDDAVAAAYDIPQDRIYDYTGSSFNPSSIINPGDFYVGPPGQYFIITYVAGYVGNKDHFIKGILDVAARVMTNNHDDSVSIKDGITRDNRDTSVTALDGLYWQTEELMLFDRDRRRVIV